MSRDTKPKFIVSFTVVTALLSPLFADLFCWAVLQPFDVRKRTLPECASRFCLVYQAFWRRPCFTRWTSRGSSKMFLARLTRFSPTRTFPQGFMDLFKFFPLCDCVVYLGESRLYRSIFTLITLVVETALVSFQKLPYRLPPPTIFAPFVH